MGKAGLCSTAFWVDFLVVSCPWTLSFCAAARLDNLFRAVLPWLRDASRLCCGAALQELVCSASLWQGSPKGSGEKGVSASSGASWLALGDVQLVLWLELRLNYEACLKESSFASTQNLPNVLLVLIKKTKAAWMGLYNLFEKANNLSS